jgi:hypothetical protein
LGGRDPRPGARAGGHSTHGRCRPALQPSATECRNLRPVAPCARRRDAPRRYAWHAASGGGAAVHCAADRLTAGLALRSQCQTSEHHAVLPIDRMGRGPPPSEQRPGAARDRYTRPSRAVPRRADRRGVVERNCRRAHPLVTRVAPLVFNSLFGKRRGLARSRLAYSAVSCRLNWVYPDDTST